MRLSDISLIAAFCVAQCERDNFWDNPSCGMAAEALINDPMQRLMQDEAALLVSPCETTSISLASIPSSTLKRHLIDLS